MSRWSQWRQDRLLRRVAAEIPALSVQTDRGVRWFVRPGDDTIGASLIQTGAFEPEMVLSALDFLERDGFALRLLVDIGANVGTTTVETLLTRPRARALCIEPDPLNHQLLRLNLIANGLDARARTLQVAVGDSGSPLEFELAASNFGDHRIRTRPPEGHGDYQEESRSTTTVPSIRLDDIAGELTGPGMLLFIDVQGYEGFVLGGARNVLASRPAMVVELWPYGLRRAGGEHLLYDALRAYPRLYDLNAGPEPVAVDPTRLDDLVERLGEGGHTDVLALG